MILRAARAAPTVRRVGSARSAWACRVLGVPIALLLGLASPPATAQVPGSTLRVSVITWGPGDFVYERFGHNALRVQDLATGMDLAYNWGMFDFNQPDFLRRFLSGDTKYWVEAFPTPHLLREYARLDRETHEQELALTPAQAAAVADVVERNAREANKYYRYDYFRDNCSTRLRDVIDHVLDGSLERRFTPLRTRWTYRSEAVRLTGPTQFSQAGIDFALGPKADVPLTAWESMFIPMRLRDYLRDVTVTTVDGRVEPLVREERLLHRSSRVPEPEDRRGLALGAWGPVLGAWMLILAPVSAASRRRTRIPAAVMAALFYGVTGVAGLLLLGMWLGSAHVFWYNNLTLLLLSPMALAAAVPVARDVLAATPSRASRILMGIVTGGAVLALLIAPFVSQRLGGPLLLLIPAHLGLAIAVWRHTHPPTEPAP